MPLSSKELLGDNVSGACWTCNDEAKRVARKKCKAGRADGSHAGLKVASNWGTWLLKQDTRSSRAQVDKGALDAQVEEKGLIKQAEADMDRMIGKSRCFPVSECPNIRAAEQLKFAAEAANAEEAEYRQQQIDELEQLRIYWRMQRNKRLGKEWDLNDPDQVRNARPPRDIYGDDDAPISSLQKFDGEDPEFDERRKRHQREVAEAAEASLAEKAAIAAAEAEGDAEYAEYQRRLQEQIEEQHAMLEDEKRDAVRKLRDENKMRAAARRRAERDQKAEEEKAAEAEVNSQLHGALLSESLAQTRNNLQPHRFRPDHFKGFTRGQYERLREEQDGQREEAKLKKKLEKEEEAYWANQWQETGKVGNELATDMHAERRAEQKQYYMDLKAQARNARYRKEMEKKEEDSLPEDTFWKRFNTSLA